MATLKKQIALIEEELNLNKQANDAQHILGEYETIRESLSKVETSIKNMFNYYQVLQVLPEDAPEKMVFSVEIKEAAKNAKFILKTFADRWQQEEHKARQGNDLANATQSLEALFLSCKAEIERCWQSWVGVLDMDVRLEDALLQSQRNIPGLEETHNEFIKARSRFRELIEQLPNDKSVITELTQLRKKMTDLKGQMQFDLPEDVSNFFKELDAFNRHVSLALVTPNVLEWLQAKNMLNEYVVSRKRKY